VREGGRVQSMAVVVAYGVRADGTREVLGLDGAPSEDVAFWRAFLQDLVARGVRGVQLVHSGAEAPVVGGGSARMEHPGTWEWDEEHGRAEASKRGVER
jgi:hypothetical protein